MVNGEKEMSNVEYPMFNYEVIKISLEIRYSMFEIHHKKII